MEELSPIPTPASQRWRQFRIQWLPFVVFFLTAGGVAYMWLEHVQPPTLVGQVETRSTTVTSPQAGALKGLQVSRFDSVSAGDPLATVVTTDPELVTANVALIEAELNLLKAELAADTRRNELDYSQLRLDWMQQRAALASAKANLEQAERDVKRLASLHEQEVVSTEALEQAESRRDALEAEVAEQSRLVEEIKAELESLRASQSGSEPGPIPDPIRAAIDVHAKRLKQTEAELKPAELTAPISGQVQTVYRHNGDNVREGDPVLEITSPEARRVIGYLQQPAAVEPKQGMQVRIRSRSSEREEALGRILEIGTQVHTVTNSHLIRGTPPQMGVPISVSLPPQLNVRPGEVVDLILEQ